MKIFLVLSTVIFLLYSCEDQSIDPEKVIYPYALQSYREDGQIIIKWQLPAIIMQYSLNVKNDNAVTAEKLELYISEADTTQFHWITEVNLNGNGYVYPENKTGKDYFFIMKCSAKGAYPSFSNIAWVNGGSNKQAEKLFDLPLDHNFNLWEIGSDDKHLIYSRNTDENYCCDTKVFAYDFQTETEESFYQKYYMPSLSIDGNKMAYVSYFEADIFALPYNLGMLEFDTDEIKQLTFGYNNYQFPLWTIDGESIFYLSPNQAVHAAWDLNQFSLDNNLATVIIAAETMPVKGKPMSVSSKNGLLAFTARENTQMGDIYFYDLVSKSIIEFEDAEWDAYNPSFSPNGDYLAFLSTRSGKREIWVKNLQNNQYFQMTGEYQVYPQGKLLWTKDNKILFKAIGLENDGVFSVDFKL